MTLNLPDQEICEKYLNGINTVELAKEYGCSDVTIGKILHNNKIKIRLEFVKLPVEEICKKYLDGISIIKLSEEYKCSQSTIKNRLQNNNIKIRSISEANTNRLEREEYPRYIKLPVKEICKKYLDGITIQQLAKEYNCSHGIIRNRLRDNNIEIKSNSDVRRGIWKGENNSKYIKLPIEEICKKYLNGMSTYQLAEEYECSSATITIRICNNGFEIRSNSDAHVGRQLGNKNPRYINLPINEISTKYLNGMNTIELAEEYNCSTFLITNRLHDNGIKLRSNSEIKSHDGHGGISQQKYCYLFNLPLKEAIRLYFNNNCFIDNEPEENGRALCVYHVNYDKRCGCDATQFCIFVPVKAKWNIKFNGSKEHNRWYWYQFLMNKIFMEHPNYFAYHIPVWGMNELEYNYNYVFEKFRRK